MYVVATLNTQLLGLAIGGMLGLLAVAAIVAGKMVVPQETERRGRGTSCFEEDKVEEIIEIVDAGGEGVSRRVLLAGAGGLAGRGRGHRGGHAAGLARSPPDLASTPRPWQRGVRFVDEEGQPLPGRRDRDRSFYTALPEGERLGAARGAAAGRQVCPQRYPPAAATAGLGAPGNPGLLQDLPARGCAISLYRYPTFGRRAPMQPAFTCPCHYSTFMPGEGGRLIFGPAGRALPQLPVMIDDDGNLRAAGEFDEDVGPSWCDVRAAA